MSTDLSRVETIFYAALEKSNPAERAAYVDQECGGDQDLREQVQRLLNAHGKVDSFLEEEAANIVATRDGAISEKPGMIIGHYKLLQQIGEGGFGVVFMADQLEPIRRKVAVKIIKPGMDSKEVIARFEVERQAPAMMDHPNIASVLDAGTTDSGLPYFVMELIKGVPIAKYCDEFNLCTSERLRLFQSVCSAIQHAHQKGVIHRDLKPSNVLITLRDGEPVVKVIDFGISKAINQQLTNKTLFTRFGQMVGTPAYMSPEQAEMSELEIDTRSDIYSLGVLLYELLTGNPPFDAATLREAGFDEMRRIIKESDPPKPSTRIESLDNVSANTVANHRRIQHRALCKQVSGDLDWIVMKALDKDRNRRYETASSFSEDLQRHLDNEPVSAGPPHLAYRVRKFARKHKALVGSLSAVMAALLVGMICSIWALRIAWTRGEHLEQLAKELRVKNEKLKNLRRIEDIEAAREWYVLAVESEDYTQKETLYGKSRDLFHRHGEHRGVVNCLRQLAMDYWNAWDYEKAIARFEMAIGVYARSPKAFVGNGTIGLTARDISVAYQELGDTEKQEEWLERATQYHREACGDNSSQTLESIARQALFFPQHGEIEKSMECWRKLDGPLTRGDKDSSPYVWSEHKDGLLNAMRLLFYCRNGLSNDPNADLQTALDLLQRFAYMGTYYYLPLATAYAESGDVGKSLEIFKKACKQGWERDLRSARLRFALIADRSHLRLLQELGRMDEYEKELRLGMQRRDSKLPPEHPQKAYVRQELAEVLMAADQYDEARTLLLEAHAILRNQSMTPKARLSELFEQLATAYEALGDNETANDWRQRVVELDGQSESRTIGRASDSNARVVPVS